MALHAGREIKIVRRPFGTSSPQLIDRSLGFRAPALSPDVTQVAYTVPTEDWFSLVIGDSGEAHSHRRLLEVGLASAFMWSPDGSELAVADQQSLGTPFFERLIAVPADGGPVRTIAEDQILAFYWAPSGDKIAWIALDPEARVFELVIAPRVGTPVVNFFRFQPSSDTFTMLGFFDQYSYSHSPWSPNGARLVVAGTRGRGNGQSPTGERVFVLDATGASAPRDIAAGTLAFWSWN